MADNDIPGDPKLAPETEDEQDSFGENYALAIALGLPIGMVVGLVVFDNIALGSVFAPIIAQFMKNQKSGESSSLSLL